MKGKAAILVALAMVTVAVPGLVLADGAEDNGSGGASAHVHVYADTYAQGDLQRIVNDANEGDVIHLHAGVYNDHVHVRTPRITIMGDGADATILDGLQTDGSKSPFDGIFVTADDVSVQDLQVRDFAGNGVFYSDVTGFYMDRLSAIDNGAYGLYAIRSQIGHVLDSYASGHSDSGLYIGETAACECLLQGNLIEGNLIGYSGTGASHVIINDNVFRDNAIGILPNVLPQEPTPQTHLIVTNNLVYDNNNYWASENWHFLSVHVPAGWGIVLAGGINDIVKDNTVYGHDKGGIALVWFFVEPSLNQVLHNALYDNGVDLWWDEGGVNNCWEANYNPTGAPVTFDGGPVWEAAGGLPDCDTPNVGVPSPTKLARLASLFFMNCEPERQVEGRDGPCHLEDPAGASTMAWIDNAWKFIPQDVKDALAGLP